MILVKSRDPKIGVHHWGNVRMPKHPLSRKYSVQDQDTTFNVLVLNNIAGSPKKVVGGLAGDLSKTKWPDSGENMFNVTMMSDHKNKVFNKLSSTFHAIKLDYEYEKYFDHDGIHPLEFKRHENRLSD